MFGLLTVLVHLLATTTEAAGMEHLGSIFIRNNLETYLYLWSVQKNDGPLYTINPKAEDYQESWKPTIEDTGISLKIATENDKRDVLQFEYSILHSILYWDLSSINLKGDSEIVRRGFSATPDIHDCAAVKCNPGDEKCPDVYQKPDDDHAVRGCPANVSIVLNIGVEMRNDWYMC
ncbi:uncharacterized protein KD926_008965 [Aspergillus affinis]|uniref:uncharacterized protein n=1 Tax=Aspergillus affinis TaxID=1070780 RepID=UPI0022FE2B3A|nr:uncharacterized protein KD926_008965 [Aspergillus affinis]KAI9039864.1 hypothetical protein KD926_008965 [Aspergillus affinis]